jgi:hypothetical protein
VSAPRARAALIAAVVPAILVLAACSATGKRLDTDQIERTVKAQFSEQTGVPVSAVSCPDHVDVKQGATFTCTATFSNGEQEPVRVTQTDGDGHVFARLTHLVVDKLQNAIEAKFARKTGPVSVECPREIPQRKGNTFLCTVTDSGGHVGKVKVTQLDDRGRVRYRLLRGGR